MKIKIVLLFLFVVSLAEAQKIIPLYSGKVPGSENWNWQEEEMYSGAWQTRVVYNVSVPSMIAYMPPKSIANGTSVVICPGGGFHALSIDTEGIKVAEWLNKNGVAAFVLKYRLVKSNTDDPVAELSVKMADPRKFEDSYSPLIPLIIDDGMEAIRYLRDHASELGLQPDRIGIMGFSAGGTVAAGVCFEATQDSRPDFVAPIYAYLEPLKDRGVPANAPPAFIAAATDDGLGLAPHSIALYSKWLKADRPAELHIYAEGGHGFGMREQNLPSDLWIERFGEWLESRGLFLSVGADKGASLTPRERLQRQKDAAARKKIAEEQFHNDWANMKRFRDENKDLGLPKAGEDRVVFMGNSIFARWKQADPDFFSSKPYINRGIGGQTSQQMLVRFKQDVIDLKPKVVVIMAGINDIAQEPEPKTLQGIMDNISGMALLARSHGIAVVLSSVLPAYDFPSKPGMEPAEKVVSINKLVKRFAEENNMVYVDFYSALVDGRKGMKKEFSNDEVHPTIEGYNVMKPLAEKGIEAALKQKDH